MTCKLILICKYVYAWICHFFSFPPSLSLLFCLNQYSFWRWALEFLLTTSEIVDMCIALPCFSFSFRSLSSIEIYEEKKKEFERLTEWDEMRWGGAPSSNTTNSTKFFFFILLFSIALSCCSSSSNKKKTNCRSSYQIPFDTFITRENRIVTSRTHPYEYVFLYRNAYHLAVCMWSSMNHDK